MQAGIGGKEISAVKKNKDAEESKAYYQPQYIDYHRANFAACSFKSQSGDSPEKGSKQGGKFSGMVHK